MNQEELDAVATTVIGALQKQRSIDNEVHKSHHDFIETQIIRVKENHETKQAIKKQVIGWGIIVFITALGTMAFEWFDAFIHRTPPQ